MESNDELKEINIKNCTCYYFDWIIKFGDFDLDNTLINDKSYENISVYNISHRTQIGSKPLRRFNEIDGFNRVYDGTRYLVLFAAEKVGFIYNRIRYLMAVKNGMTC